MIFTSNLASLTTATAAAAIGSATSAYAVGRTALFAVDNGANSGGLPVHLVGGGRGGVGGRADLAGHADRYGATTTADYVFGA